MDLKDINTTPTQPVIIAVGMTISVQDRAIQYTAQLAVFSHKVEDLRRAMDTAWESIRLHINESDEDIPDIADNERHGDGDSGGPSSSPGA